jgi:hypothetical protein
MLRSSRLARLTLVGVVALSLAGCSVLEDISRTGGSIVDGASIDSALAAATEQIEAIDGVETVDSSSILQGDFTYQVSIDVAVEDPSVESTQAIAGIVFEAYGRPGFARAPRSLLITHRGDGVLSISTFELSRETLEDEIDFQFTIGAASGSRFALTLDSVDESAGYHRGLSSQDASPRAFSEVRSIPDPTDAVFTQWSIPGIAWRADWPTDEAFEFLESTVDSIPSIELYDGTQTTTGVYMEWWSASEAAVFIYYTEPPGVAAITATPDWQQIDDVVGQIRESGLPVATIQIIDMGGSRNAAITTTRCLNSPEPTADDIEFFNALTNVPEGMVPGACYL